MNNIPVLCVSGESLSETYEAALVSLYTKGTRFKTQYDKPGDPLSLDCTLNATVLNPESDPMIHQAFPGGIDELKEYVMELKGFKDHWVKNMNDPQDTRWEYTYHGRLQRNMVAVMLIIMGIALEYMQGYDPKRYFEIADMVANSTGVVIGFLVALSGAKNCLIRVEKLIR